MILMKEILDAGTAISKDCCEAIARFIRKTIDFGIGYFMYFIVVALLIGIVYSIVEIARLPRKKGNDQPSFNDSYGREQGVPQDSDDPFHMN